MTYRDDQAALAGRVESLEAELEAAKQKIAQLSGVVDAKVIGDGEKLGPVTGLGVPSSLRLAKVIDGELSPAGYEAVAGLLRSRLGFETTQVGTRLETLDRPRQPAGRVQVFVEAGKTHVLIERDWSERSRGAWFFSGVIGFFGGLMVLGLLHDILRLSDGASFVQLLYAAPLITFISSLFIRPFVRRQVEAELAARRGAFAALVDVVAQHTAPPGRARVAASTPGSESEAMSDEQATDGADKQGSTQAR